MITASARGFAALEISGGAGRAGSTHVLEPGPEQKC